MADSGSDSAAATAQRFWSLAGTARDLGSATLVACPEAPAQPRANFLYGLRSSDAADLDRTLAAAAEVLGCACPRVVLDEATPLWATARLVHQNWRIEHELSLVLDAHTEIIQAPPRPLRPLVDKDDEWRRLRALFRLDHVEEDEKAGRPIRPEISTDDAIAVRRGLVRGGARYFVAEEGGHVTGSVCSWPGDHGIGVVEDVFVHPESRYRRLATALVSTAVTDARQHGARSMVISADPNDTPKRLYARLGFAPTALSTSLLAPETP